MRNFFYNHGIEAMIVLAVVGLIATMVAGAWLEGQERPGLYGAWLKLNPGSELTYEEWSVLERNHLLPGQSAQAADAQATANAALAISAASMATSAAR